MCCTVGRALGTITKHPPKQRRAELAGKRLRYPDFASPTPPANSARHLPR